MTKFNRIGLYFGSFNPIHEGHFHVINTALSTTIDKLYLVVSPQSPFKPISELAPFEDRLEMARIAIKEHNLNDFVEVVDWQKHMYPSYTGKTLRESVPMLKDNEIVIFMGLDNFLTIDKWKEPDYILETCAIFIIPRDTNDAPKIILEKQKELEQNITKNIKGISYSNPLKTFDMSATEIRTLLDVGENVDGMLTNGVQKYLKEKKLYIKPKETMF